MKLTISRCPRHSDFWSVSIDGENSGLRVTPSKCCGSWQTVKAWNLSAEDWREIAKESLKAAEAVESKTAKVTP